MPSKSQKQTFTKGAIILALALMSWLLLAGIAHAQESDEFEHPDYIIVELLGTPTPLDGDGNPDESQPTITSVNAIFKIYQNRGELIWVKDEYAASAHLYKVNVNPNSSIDVWDFVFSAPKWEQNASGKLMRYSLNEIPTPGFDSSIWVDDDGVSHITNTRNLGELTWTKIDSETSEALGGSEWVITGADGFSMTIVDNGENDEDPAVGSMKVSGLKWGVKKSTGNLWGAYELTEAKAPEGYDLNVDSYSFEINESTDFAAAIVVGPIENSQRLGQLTWTKIDSETSEALGGSEWVITGADGFSMTIVDNGENDEDPAVGSMKVSGLKWGIYDLLETKAPEGYELKSNSNSFEINSSTISLILNPIVNNKIPCSPGEPTNPPTKVTQLAKTGDNPVAPIMAGAGLFALLAGFAFYRIRRVSFA